MSLTCLTTISIYSTLNVTDMFDHNLNPPYQIQALPVVERETVTGTHAQQVTAKYSLSSKLRFEGLLLFEILEKLDTRTVLTYCIPVREGRRKKREKEGERKGEGGKSYGCMWQKGGEWRQASNTEC